MSHTLLILKIYTTFKDVQMILKRFFDISTGFQIFENQCECSVHLCSCPWLMLQFFFIQIEKLDKQMTDLIPLEKHGERCLLRDKRLAALAKLKRNLKESEWKKKVPLGTIHKRRRHYLPIFWWGLHMPSDNLCWSQLLF